MWHFRVPSTQSTALTDTSYTKPDSSIKKKPTKKTQACREKTINPNSQNTQLQTTCENFVIYDYSVLHTTTLADAGISFESVE